MTVKAQRKSLTAIKSSSVPLMRCLQDHIAAKQGEMAGHALFRQMRRKDITIDAAFTWVPSMAFFTFAFQDILRVNVDRVTDPAMKSIARHHQMEDGGHDEWYLFDLAALGFEEPKMSRLFDKRSVPLKTARDTAYEVISESFRVDDDRLRVILLMSIEAVSHVFFSGVVEAVERLGVVEEVKRRNPQSQMKYYARSHLDVEKDHEMFDEDRDGDKIAAIVLQPKVYQDACGVVDRVFASLSRMFSAFATEVEAATAAKV